MSYPILKTKFYKPIIKDSYVIRKEIIENLEKNRKNPLTLVVAPTGYGKSTIISEWLDYTKARFCWLSLDEEFNDLKVFFIYLVYTIRSVFPNALSSLKELLSESEMPQQMTLIKLLINELDESQEDLIIVLDDYHVIENKDIHEIINVLLKNSLPNLHLVIISRKDPALNLNVLHTFGKITELRMSHLNFRLEEVLALAKKNLNFPIDVKLAMLLLQKTEGWIVGLRMAMLQIAENIDIETSVKEFKVEQNYFQQYLLEEVIQRYPEPVRNLFLIASIFDRFSRELLEYLIDDVDMESTTYSIKVLIDQPRSSTLFVIPLDNENKWFRFHHLFKDLLQSQLSYIYSEQDVKRLCSKACDWFLSQNLIDEAIQYAIKCSNYDRAVKIIEQNRLSKITLEQWWVVKKWIQKIPAAVVEENTLLQLTNLLIYQEEYRYEELIYNIQKLEQKLSDQPGNKYLGELLIHKGYLNTWILANPKEAIDQLKKSVRLFPDFGEMGMRRVNSLAVALQMAGEKEEAILLLRRESENDEYSEHLRRSIFSTLATVHLLAGELKQAISVANRYIAQLAEKQLNSKIFWAEFLQTNALFQSNEIKKAEKLFKNHLSHKDIIYPGVIMNSLIGYSLTTYMLGNHDVSENGLRELKTYASQTGIENFILMAESCRARIHLLQNRIDLALEWTKTYSDAPYTTSLHFFIEVPAITRARIWIASMNDSMVKDAVDDLKILLDKVQSVHNYFQMVDILVLLAVGYFLSGNKTDAEKALKRAMDISRDNGFIRPFIEPGEHIVKILKDLPLDEGYEKFLSNLRKYWSPEDHNLYYKNDSNYNLESENEIGLKKREKELLQLIAKGLSNKEIAETLYLSPNTVRKYLYKLFQKLNVNNRTQAAQKATELNLI